MPVISLYESELHGIIYNVLFDPKSLKVKYMCVLNEEDGIQHVLNISDIFKIGKNCVFIKNSKVLELECTQEHVLNYYNNILNLKVYNMAGEELGNSQDIEIDEKFKINDIILNSQKVIPSSNIINIGKSIILTNESKANISRFKPRYKHIKYQEIDSNKVIILNDLNTKSKDVINNKIMTNSSFLIGRTLTQDIQAPNGEIIAKKNSIINNELLNKASIYGKVIEIARHSIKK